MEIENLIKECQGGSIAATKCLYDNYADAMFMLCRLYMKTDEDAEEMMMNGFLKFFKSIHQFEFINDAATKAFLKKIMLHECLMQLRKKKNWLVVAQEEAEAETIDDGLFSKIEVNEIFKLITQLPAGYRTVFNLAVIEGMNHKEIALALGISEGTSKSQLSKAKQQIQKLILQNNSYYAHTQSR